MKISVKIFLLVLFVVVAIGAVLIFVKTQVGPPADIKLHDQYSAPLNAAVDSVGMANFPQCTDPYLKARHKALFMNREDVLDDEQANNILSRIHSDYGQKVNDYAYGIFNSREWPEENLTLLANTMNELKTDTLVGGQPAISSETSDAFSQIDGIVSRYREAWNFSKNTAYKSIADASTKINKAEEYRNMQYLSNNASLVRALGEMRGKIANNHYAYVAGQVGRLSRYHNMSRSEFNNLRDHVKGVLNEYKGATIYGGDKKSHAPLEKQAAEAVRHANDYYDAQEAQNQYNYYYYD